MKVSVIVTVIQAIIVVGATAVMVVLIYIIMWLVGVME